MTDLVISPEGVRVRGLRRAEFERMVDTGTFVGEPVELLGGELIESSPQGVRHGWVIEELTVQLAPLLASGYAVRVQLPLGIDGDSLPEPDVAITDRQTAEAHPTTAHAVIEVAETSQVYDLAHKAPRYAAADVPLYLVVDLPAREVVVHTDPRTDGYGSITRVGPHADVTIHDVPLDLVRLLDG